MNDIKVTIWSVGQGDCITLEWYDDEGVPQIGIIDCHNGNNNVEKIKNYLHANSYNEIYFIVMTHPHYDHYSGLLPLVSWLEKTNRTIRHFYLSTFNSVLGMTAALKSFHKRKEGKNEPQQLRDLRDLHNKLFRLEDNQFVNQLYNIDGYTLLPLNKGEIKLEFVSPSIIEVKKYWKLENFKKVDSSYDLQKEDVNNPNANSLSIMSILKDFENNKTLALFTSDGEVETFDRYRTEKNPIAPVNGEQFLLVQVPHHGSGKNHNQEFWDSMLMENTQCFISVGKSRYNHPDHTVVDYFTKKSKGFNSTQYGIGGLKLLFRDDMINHLSNGNSNNYTNDWEGHIVYYIKEDATCEVFQ